MEKDLRQRTTLTGVPSRRRFGVPAKARFWPSRGEVLRLLRWESCRRIGHRVHSSLPKAISTEASSVLPRVKITSQRETSFWNSGRCERVVVAIIRRWREQRMRISQFTAYSLLFTVLCGGENREFP